MIYLTISKDHSIFRIICDVEVENFDTIRSYQFYNVGLSGVPNGARTQSLLVPLKTHQKLIKQLGVLSMSNINF